MSDSMTVYDARGRPLRRLVRIGRVGVPWDAPDDGIGALGNDIMDNPRSGAVIKVEHRLDPEAQEVIRELRRGAPIAAAVGGALVGAALIALLIWAMSDSE